MTAYLLDLADAYRRWKLTRRTINALERLDDRMLDDAGIDRYQIGAIAARQARSRVTRDRIESERRSNERAEQRELTRREALVHSRFALALDQAATATHLALTIGSRLPANDFRQNRSRIPSVIDDIALGAAFRGERCLAC
jgi:uncharacterized protein YjiS (DUF1127 family)